MPKVGENLTKEQSMAGMKRLKPMQQEFLNNYLHKDMTQTAAAREAGYKNPSVSAVRLLQNKVVQERLQEMRLEAQAKFGRRKATWQIMRLAGQHHKPGNLAHTHQPGNRAENQPG